MGTGQQLYKRALDLIPGGTQLLSKRPEMFLPQLWPSYFAKAKGAEVWDLDNNRYIDATHFGVGAPVLGFADPDVDRAVINAIHNGTACTLNCPDEVKLAEMLIELHPWAEMVRFARGGGEVMAMAARIARAATGRDMIAVCGYHGWHDWYLAANLAEDGALNGHLLPGLEPNGLPRGLTSTIVTFRYNDFKGLEAVLANHGDKLAAIIMEPTRNEGPAPGFLEKVRETADKCGAVLVFDEVTSGWRINTGGAHLTLGVMPDMAAFAKAMANGYAMAAVIGKRSVMDAAQSSFISSTMWSESTGPAAALATICKHRSCNVPAHLIRIGERVQRGWREAGQNAGLKLHVGGMAPLSHLGFEHEEPLAVATLFIQGMLDRGYLAGTSFYSSLAHTDEIIDGYLSTLNEIFVDIAKAVEEGSVHDRLRGPVKHGGFSRLN